tara:strand:- start:325 stop:927 length:603 start_codon:yes stop_codon:yes gene_type:complete
MKKKKILIGTFNRGKFKEISYLLPKKFKKVSPDYLNIKGPKETGKTFLENSKIKARYFFKKSNIVTISDDSGLCIDCLRGKPGIFSARWAKKYGSFKKAMKKILIMVKKKNKNKKYKNFKAKFICSLTVCNYGKKTFSSVGILDGKISEKILGDKGFGYDPIFIPKNHKLTFGQMHKKQKIFIDHRFIAFKKIKRKLKTL